jgi:hypothetical protein
MSCTERDFSSLDINQNVSEIEIEEVRISPARCSYEDCICRVNIPRYVPQFVDVNSKSWTSVFFAESQSTLSQEYAKNVIDFMRPRMSANTAVVLGYTDGCGSYSYNTVLSKNRASVVSRLIRTIGFRNRIVTVGMSELTSHHSDLARRADVITSHDFRIQVPPPNLVADHYLLDASGSIQDYELWVNIIAANKKPTSQLHLSYTYRCTDGTSANNVRPGGATEIWWSYWQVLDRMRPGQTLLILSDFNSRYPLTNSESQAIIEKARRKGVKVYAVRI